MKKLYIPTGILLGLVSYYVLCLSSALWGARVTPLDYVWGILLSAAMYCVLGVAVARRVGAALVAGGVMLVLVVMSLIAGSDLYLWVAPLPTDIPSLFFHGARTPLVVSAMVLLVTVGIARLVADRNHHVSRIPSETREREAEGTLH